MTHEARLRLIERVRLKFTSANGVEVERAVVTRDEIQALLDEEREAAAQIAEDRLRWVHQDACYEEIAAAIRARGAGA